MVPEISLDVYAGDTWRASLVITDQGGAPVDLTDPSWSWRSQLRRDASVVEVEVDVSRAAEGVLVLGLEPDVTQTLRGGELDVESRRVDPDSGRPIVRTWLRASVRVRQDVTRD